MKVKTMKLVITKKLNEWLASIEDEELSKDVRANLVLSGGSITSMLLQEPVNDYDIYIEDPLVCIRLAKYYVNQIPKTIEILDGNLKDKYIKEKGLDVLVYNPDKEEKDENLSLEAIMYKTLMPGQVKIKVSGAGYAVVESRKSMKEKKKHVDGGIETSFESKPYRPVFFSQNAISLSDDIQIVTRFTGTVEEIHKSYDFVHATNYFTFKDGLVLNSLALQCILTKELRYQGSLYPLTSVIRMKKFIGRKWTMNAGEVLKMLWQCAELDLNNPIVLEEQLVGVDIAYFSELVECLSKLDPEQRNYSHLAKLIDKIFNEYDGDI